MRNAITEALTFLCLVACTAAVVALCWATLHREARESIQSGRPLCPFFR